MRNRTTFDLGLDYVISQDNKPYLLEANLQEGIDYLFPQSAIEYFAGISFLWKTHQHQIFKELMPESTQNRKEFDSFIESHKAQVVYKLAKGTVGDGVSVLTKPEWEVDLLEVFIAPKIQRINKRDYPYVIRDLITIVVKDKNFRWKRKKIFRKRAKIAIGESEDINEVFRLNVYAGNAKRVPPSKEDIIIIEQMTQRVIERFSSIGKAVEWNPTNYFNDPIVGFYYGPTTQDERIPKDLYKVIKKLSIENKINLKIVPIGSDIKGISRAIKYGSDAVICNNYYSFKDYTFDSYGVRIEGEIISTPLGGIRHKHQREVIPPKENLFLLGKQSSTELAKSILDLYKKNLRSKNIDQIF